MTWGDWHSAIEADWRTLYPDPVERLVVRTLVEPLAERILLHGTEPTVIEPTTEPDDDTEAELPDVREDTVNE